MDLNSILKDISPEALSHMSGKFADRSVSLLVSGDPTAQPWARLYSYLSAEMTVAAFQAA